MHLNPVLSPRIPIPCAPMRLQSNATVLTDSKFLLPSLPSQPLLHATTGTHSQLPRQINSTLYLSLYDLHVAAQALRSLSKQSTVMWGSDWTDGKKRPVFSPMENQAGFKLA